MASLPDFSAGLVEVLDGDQTATLTTQDPAQLGLPSVVKRYALPIEWEQRKPLIRQLYLAENKPLREVIEILGKHGHYGRYVAVSAPEHDRQILICQQRKSIQETHQQMEF